MKLEAIYDEWSVDCVIDPTELGFESLKITELHNKYFRFLSNERLTLRNLEVQYKQLRLEKFEFYTQGPTKETQEKGWTLPPVGRILKSEVNTYIEADRDIVNLTLKIAVQQEKIDLLESIIKNLQNRNFNIKSAIEWEKFKMGG